MGHFHFLSPLSSSLIITPSHALVMCVIEGVCFTAHQHYGAIFIMRPFYWGHAGLVLLLLQSLVSLIYLILRLAVRVQGLLELAVLLVLLVCSFFYLIAGVKVWLVLSREMAL